MLFSWASERGHLPDLVITGEKGTLHLWPRERFVDYYPTTPRSIPALISHVRPYSLQSKLMIPSLQRVRLRLRDKDPTGYLSEMKEFLSSIIERRQPASFAAGRPP
jgi:hypothetical protein